MANKAFISFSANKFQTKYRVVNGSDKSEFECRSCVVFNSEKKNMVQDLSKLDLTDIRDFKVTFLIKAKDKYVEAFKEKILFDINSVEFSFDNDDLEYLLKSFKVKPNTKKCIFYRVISIAPNKNVSLKISFEDTQGKGYYNILNKIKAKLEENIENMQK